MVAIPPSRTAAAAAAYDSLTAYYKSDGTRQLIGGAGAVLTALDTSGVVVASVTTSTGPHTFARFGSPSAEYIFAANGTDMLYHWDGSTWANSGYTDNTSTGLNGKVVAEYAKSNRVALGHFSGSAVGNDPSTIRFSNAGDPLTWDANDYVDLTPGDGEGIMAIVPWREYLFVFKETKYFVFYGESVASDGTVEFVYRPVNTGLGLVASGAVIAAKDAVYFLTHTGVYKTVGSEPVRVSNLIDGVFRSVAPTFYSGSVVNQSNIDGAKMGEFKERIWLSVPTAASTNDRTFIFDTNYQWWTVYDFPMNAMAPFSTGGDDDLYFALATGTNDIVRHRDSDTDDDGTDISSFWYGGWWDHGKIGIQKVREYWVSGFGDITVAMGTDFHTPNNASSVNLTLAGIDTWGDGTDASDVWADGTDPTDTWGSGIVIDTRLIRRAVRGQVFSLQITGTGVSWEVHRAAVRVAGTPSPYRIHG